MPDLGFWTLFVKQDCLALPSRDAITLPGASSPSSLSFRNPVPPPDPAADPADRRAALDVELFAQGARDAPQEHEQGVRPQTAGIAGKQPSGWGRPVAGRPR